MTTDDRILPPNFSIMYSLQSIDGYDPLYIKRYGELIAAMERNAPDIEPPLGFNRILTPANYNSKIADLLNVKYVLSLSDLASPKLKKVFQEGETRIYENLEVLPRAFFVDQVITSSDKQQTINKLFDKRLDLRQTAIVEDWDQNQNTFNNSSNPEIVSYESNKIVVKLANKEKSFIVLTDTFYPTWTAQICDENQTICNETKIYLTNYNFRGVIVPPGSHTLVFTNSLL
jgi:hypothetical protein